MSAIRSNLIFFLLLLLASCIESRNTENDDVNHAISKTVNKDSLVNQIYEFTQGYFSSNSIDSIVKLKGRPQYVSRIPWGEHVADSMLTIGYDKVRFDFWEGRTISPELANIDLIDEDVILPGNISIGRTTRKDILQNVGLPDSDYNDSSRSITKTGDTIEYGTKSGAGDTITFVFYINIDEFAIGFSMTQDTLRKISWSKNPY